MLSSRAAMVGNQKIPSPSGITFQSVAVGSYVGALAASWQHVITAPANCLLVLVASNSISPPGMTIDTGQTFTFLNALGYTSFSNIYYYLYGLMNPTVGTRTINTSIGAFAGYAVGGTSIAYSGVTGFAANLATFNNSTGVTLSLPAFPGGVAVMGTNSGWTSATQTSRQNSGAFGWQESTTNTATSARVKGTANAVLGTSVTIPAHAVGDLIVVFAYQNGVAAAPTAPAASGTVPSWSLIQGGGSNSNGSGVWSFTATTTSHTSGTWTNCAGLIAVVIEGAKTNNTTSPIGGFAYMSLNGASTAPAITQSVTDGSSCLLYFHGHRSNVTAFGAAPTGFTRQAAAVGSSGICLNTKDVTTSNSMVTQTDDGNGGSVGQTVEILGNPATTQNFSTTWAASSNHHAVGVVLK